MAIQPEKFIKFTPLTPEGSGAAPAKIIEEPGEKPDLNKQKLDALISKFRNGDMITDEDYSKLITLLGEQDPPVTLEPEYVKGNGTVLFTVIKFEIDGKSCVFRVNKDLSGELGGTETTPPPVDDAPVPTDDVPPPADEVAPPTNGVTPPTTKEVTPPASAEEPAGGEDDGIATDPVVDNFVASRPEPDSAIEKIIAKFVSGSLTWKEFMEELKNAGVDTDTSNSNVWEHNNSQEMYNFTFKHDGQTYNVTLKSTAETSANKLVNNGKDNDNTFYTKKELEKAGITDDLMEKAFYCCYSAGEGKSEEEMYFALDITKLPADLQKSLKGKTLSQIASTLKKYKFEDTVFIDNLSKDIKVSGYRTKFNDVEKGDGINIAVSEILNDSSLKNSIEDSLDLSETVFDEAYKNAVEDCINFYNEKAGEKDGGITFVASDVINKFMEFLYKQIKNRKTELTNDIKNTVNLEDIPGYTADFKKTIEHNNIKPTIEKMLNNSALKSSLRDYADGQQKSNYTDAVWDSLYRDVVAECVKFFQGKGGEITVSNKEVYDKFMELMSNKLNNEEAVELNNIDLETLVSGYSTNQRISGSGGTRSEADNDLSDKIIDNIYKIKGQIKSYMEDKLGVTLTDQQFEGILKNLISKITAGSNVVSTRSGSPECGVKDVVDALIKELPDFCKNNKPSKAEYEGDALKTIFSDSEISQYFEETSYGRYKLSSELDSIFEEYIKRHGHIISPLELRAAVDDLKVRSMGSDFKAVADAVDNLDGKRGEMTAGITSIHTEFGVDKNGNIVFEQPDTTKVYNKVKETIKRELMSTVPSAMNAIGDTNIDKLIQAAWITAYNSNPSSESHNTVAFIQSVIDSFKSIMTKLGSNPEYMSVYTAHTAYANAILTYNLTYYGRTNDDGGDSVWVYEGSSTVDSEGNVSWDDTTDAGEYNTEMKLLLKNILNTSPYNSIDPEIITRVFRDAQTKALDACHENTNDCPYGTTSQVDGTYHNTGFGHFIGSVLGKSMLGAAIGIVAGPFGIAAGIVAGAAAGFATAGDFTNNPVSVTSLAAPEHEDWAGTNRKKDHDDITIQALVEMTLYYFDKLLYAELAK